MAEMSKKVWRYSQNSFDILNPGDMSVVAKWPLIDSGDVITSALTAVVAPTGDPSDAGVNGIAGDSTGGQHGVAPVAGLTAEQHELVVYARAGNKTVLYLADSTVSTASAYFNLSTGVVGTVGAAATAGIKSLGNSWYRCSIRFTGTSAAHTIHISPVDADASVTMTGGNASTVNVYIYRPGLYAIRARLPEEIDPEEELRTTDDGDLLIGGLGEDGRALVANVSRANATRSTSDRVVLVQNVNASGTLTTPVDIAAQTLTAVKVSKDASANATGNRIWVTADQDMVAGTAVAVNSGNLSAGVQRVTLCTDGLVGNVTGTPGNAAKSSSFQIGGQDGTNLRTLLTDSSGDLYVQPAVVPSFEDSVNGWAKTRATSHASACAADTATVTVDGTTAGDADELIASTNVSTYRGFTLWVENLGATAFSHVYVYASRDGTNWVCVDAIKNALEIACDTLGATSNGICFSVTDNPGWQYVKCAATVAAGSTTATGALSYQM